MSKPLDYADRIYGAVPSTPGMEEMFPIRSRTVGNTSPVNPSTMNGVGLWINEAGSGDPEKDANDFRRAFADYKFVTGRGVVGQHEEPLGVGISTGPSRAIGSIINTVLPDAWLKAAGIPENLGEAQLPGFAENFVVGMGRQAAATGQAIGRIGHDTFSPAMRIAWQAFDMLAEQEGADTTTHKAAAGLLDNASYNQWLEEKYKEAEFYRGTTAGQSMGGLAGELGFSIISTLPVPAYLGVTTMAKALSGSVMGAGVTAGTMFLPEDESIVPYVLLGGALGGTIGTLAGKLGPKFSQMMAQGKKIGPQDLARIHDELNLPVPDDLRGMANAVNEELSRFQGKELGRMRETVRSFADDISGLTAAEVEFNSRIFNVLQTNDAFKTVDMLDFITGKASPKELHSRYLASMGLDEVTDAGTEVFDKPASARQIAGLRQFLGPKNATKARKKVEEDIAWGMYRGDDVAGAVSREKAWKSFEKSSKGMDTAEAGVRAEDDWIKQEQKFARRKAVERAPGRAAPEVLRDDDWDAVYEAADALETGDPNAMAKLNKAAMARADAAFTTRKAYAAANKQLGVGDIGLLRDVAAGGIGALSGYAINEEQGAIVGAVMGIGGAHLGSRYVDDLASALFKKRLATRLKAQNVPPKQAQDMIRQGEKALSAASGMWWRRPRVVMESYGASGRFISKGVQTARDRAEITIGTKLTHAMSMLKEHGVITKGRGIFDYHTNTEAAKQLRRVMNKEWTKADGPVPENIAKVANYMSKEFDNVLTEAQKKGALTADEVSALRARVKDKGYWPRVYNRPYLASDKGRQRFVEKLSSTEFKSKRDLHDTVASIVGEDSKNLDGIVKLHRQDGGVFYLTQEGAERLLRHHTTRAFVGRSAHLQKARKLSVQAEEILDEFVVNDPAQVLSQYFDDVYRQIEFSNIFGRNDEMLEPHLQTIAKEFGESEEVFSRQFYWHNVNDPKALAIKKAMAMSNEMTEFLGHAGAWANLHLVFAQMLNMFQAGVFGSVLASKHLGFQGIRHVIGGAGDLMFDRPITMTDELGNQFTKPASVIAQETGADLETVMVNYIAENAAMNHYLIGSKATSKAMGSQAYNWNEGGTNPIRTLFNTLNDPTTFLKNIGFTKVEEIQRRWAALTGIRVAKDLYEEMGYLQKAGRWKEGTKDYKRITGALDELGLAHDQEVAEMVPGGLRVAGLRFSNAVNFRNTSDLIPLNWQNPRWGPIKRFKTFAYHTQNFLLDNKGSGKAMTTYLGLSATLGPAVYELRGQVSALLTGDEGRRQRLNAEGWEEKLGKGILTLGGAGLILDSLIGASTGEKLISTVAGPYYSDLANIGVGAFQSVKEMDASIAGAAFVKNAPAVLSTPAALATKAVTGRDPRKRKRSGKSSAYSSAYPRYSGY